MHILVIGGTRFIGPPVLRRLAERGHQLTVFHRGRSQTELPPGTSEVLGDRREPGALGALAERRPDLVLDMVPVIEQDGVELVNAFTGRVGRLVLISSMDVYRQFSQIQGKELELPIETGPATENGSLRSEPFPHRGAEPRADDDPQKILDDYDKIPIERAVLDARELPATVLRLPMVYGPGDYQHRTHSYVKRFEDGRPAILLEERVARVRFTRGFVENVAHAIVLALEAEGDANHIYNVGEPVLEEAAWLGAVAQAAGWAGRIVEVATEALPEELRAGFPPGRHLECDSSRIRRELGYAEVVPFEEGMARTVEWQRRNAPEKAADSFDYEAEDRVLATLEGEAPIRG